MDSDVRDDFIGPH